MPWKAQFKNSLIYEPKMDLKFIYKKTPLKEYTVIFTHTHLLTLCEADKRTNR